MTKVIAGKYKGRRLKTVRGRQTRATSARVREALFTILGPQVDGCRFADLYAGTGAVGIESLSRGAAFCAFVERRHPVAKVIAANLHTVGAQDNAMLRVASVDTWIKEQQGTDSPYDILFLDPPYGLAGIGTVLYTLGRANVVAPDGVIVIEHSTRTAAHQPSAELELTRTYTYGDSALTLYHPRA